MRDRRVKQDASSINSLSASQGEGDDFSPLKEGKQMKAGYQATRKEQRHNITDSERSQHWPDSDPRNMTLKNHS